VSASVNLPLHHKVQKSSSGTGSPRWSQKKGRKTVVVVVVVVVMLPASDALCLSTARQGLGIQIHCGNLFLWLQTVNIAEWNGIHL